MKPSTWIDTSDALTPCLTPCLRNLASRPASRQESQAIDRALQRVLLGSSRTGVGNRNLFVEVANGDVHHARPSSSSNKTSPGAEAIQPTSVQAGS